MIPIIKIMLIGTLWIMYGGLIALAIVYDGIYIQVCIDVSIMTISGIMGYIISSKQQK